MKRYFLAFTFLIPALGWCQLNYPAYKDLTGEIQRLSSSAHVQKASIGKSFGGEDIPVLKIQQSTTTKPTLLIVAGIDGRHPAGTLQALQVTKNLINLPQDSLNKILADKSIWIVPLLNPDAYKRNVASVAWASGNARAIDNDRDGRLDEDPVRDLNQDGVISQMRVKSLAGTYVNHKDYANYLVEADILEGETGMYTLYKEGVDTDKDGFYGEDGDGGVNIDRNFTYTYPAFTPESGEYAASEPETRAIVDFLFDNPQIATVLHFGLQNNLSEPEKLDQRKASERIVGSWLASDVEVSKYVSHLYGKTTKSLGPAPKAEASAGNFSSTAYYHVGKFSFVTPGWWPHSADSTKRDNKTGNGKEADLKFAQWVQANNVQGAILPWTKVNHPDFPNQEVEVGGIVEVFRNNPPASFLEAPAQAHTDFVVNLVKSMATLSFDKPVVTNLGEDVYRIELNVVNTGLLPTYPEIADRIKHVSKFKTVCELQSSQQFLSGKRLQLYPTLGAGKSLKVSWLVKGKGKVSIVAGCPTAGEKTIEVTL